MLEDLIMQAGGLLDGASTVRVEVARRLKDAKSTTPSNDVGKVYTFSLKEGLVVDGDAGFELAPFDVVEVRPESGAISPSSGSGSKARSSSRAVTR